MRSIAASGSAAANSSLIVDKVAARSAAKALAFCAVEPRKAFVDKRSYRRRSLGRGKRRGDEFSKRGVALRLVDYQFGEFFRAEFDKRLFIQGGLASHFSFLSISVFGRSSRWRAAPRSYHCSMRAFNAAAL